MTLQSYQTTWSIRTLLPSQANLCMSHLGTLVSLVIADAFILYLLHKSSPKVALNSNILLKAPKVRVPLYLVPDFEKIQSQTHKNDQATIKMRYCGHLYSRLLGKWTHLDQPDRVFYYKEGGPTLKTIGSLCCGLVRCIGVGPLFY